MPKLLSLLLPLLLLALLVPSFSPDLLAQQLLAGHRSEESELHHLPLIFEPNQGQAGHDVSYLARGTVTQFSSNLTKPCSCSRRKVSLPILGSNVSQK